MLEPDFEIERSLVVLSLVEVDSSGEKRRRRTDDGIRPQVGEDLDRIVEVSQFKVALSHQKK